MKVRIAMRRFMTFSVLLPAALAVLSCGGSPSEEASGEHGEGFFLEAVLAIGVESGDSLYVFGTIADAAVTADGTILVLDGFDNTIRAYDDSGEFVRTAGGRGEGPGEFGRPLAMVALDDGMVAVSDVMLSRVTLLGTDLNESVTISGFVPWAPERISAASGSSFTGSHRTFDRENSLYGHLVALWRGSPDPELEYYRREGAFNMDRLRESTEEHQIVFTSDREGRVYIAPYSRTEYRIDVLDPSGEKLYSISERREPEYRPVEEIEEERVRMRRQLDDEGAPPDMAWEPADRYPMIPLRGMGIDGDGRLWVRDGRERIPSFSVYSMGEHLFDASLDDPEVPSDDLTVRVTPEGILAWQRNPETFPRLFALELIRR